MDAYGKRAADSDLPRRPDGNNPWKPEPRRVPRQRTYRDPIGETAIGNIKKEKKP